MNFVGSIPFDAVIINLENSHQFYWPTQKPKIPQKQESELPQF